MFFIYFHSPVDKTAYLLYNIYDAWDNHRVLDTNYNEITDTSHVGHINPIRYHGYYYDTETNLYYLNARYYDPETGRFISKDDVDYLEPDSVNGYNLFTYCYNNPVMYSDPSGNEVAGATIASIIGVCAIFLLIAAVVYLEVETHAISNTIDAIYNLDEKIKNLIAEYATTIEPKRKYNNTQNHHIVAQKDPRALFARRFLRLSHIDINDSRNIAAVENGYHRVMHTNTYYHIVNLSIGIGYFTGGAEGVEAVLAFYKKILGGLK